MLDQTMFKANDIRGRVGPGGLWDADGARVLGRSWVQVLGLVPGDRLVLGRDMRTSSPELSRAFAEGVTGCGVDVVDTGLCSTDGLWFASGFLDLPGVMFTASHNPGHDNGIKFCLSGARPVSASHLVELAGVALAGSATVPDGVTPGRVESRDLLPDYTAHLHSLVDLSGLGEAPPLTVVADAGNGMAGHTLPSVLGGLPIRLVGLFTDLDGSFPNHQPNPLEPENLVDAQRAVREHGADLALVFDGDADRCFIIDERGEVVAPSAITALIAAQELAREPGGTVVVNTITSRSVAEVVQESGGTVVVSKVGHTYVKAVMAEHDAVFGGEHSAHYYFRDFWRADTGMLAALHVLALRAREGRPVSELVARFERYVASGELNSTVADAAATCDLVETAFAGRGTVDRTDGLTVSGEGWWFNLRASNTEPLLRLNVEAVVGSQMESVRDEVLALVRGTTTPDLLTNGA
ncbi:phosphohexomutase domain-containing protein [Auraticoccus monumenti]|uniref:Phosphomannomutase n=1 Tax=Auraticoccus monumenti TaxID=675864 RepID=A0A1G6Z486_9ACTN|nr:phosphomannomutase/phosphoglucomutase [Auraticoccus monumenti]SDD97428.1 phosphomannomutase [Auraticoccus monumenti]